MSTSLRLSPERGTGNRRWWGWSRSDLSYADYEVVHKGETEGVKPEETLPSPFKFVKGGPPTPVSLDTQ